MAEIEEVEYKPLLSAPESDGEEEEPPPVSIAVQSAPENGGGRWSHVGNLDEFFTRIYEFYMYSGFAAIALEQVMELVQFLFIVFFAAFLVTTIRLDNLFGSGLFPEFDALHNVTDPHGRTAVLSDVIDLSRLANINPLVIILLLIAMVAWGHHLIKALWKTYKFWEIRCFYIEALHIPTSELRNYSWSEVVERLKEAQQQHRMAIQKKHINELEDVYHRILRFTNYEVALVNKSILPTKIRVPLYGEKLFFTHGLRYNFQFIFFKGPWAIFKDSFHLREEYRDGKRRLDVAKSLQNYIAVVALVNLIFSPLILVYQILHSFFTYAEMVKHEPGAFGSRRWSEFGRLYLRHYNELDHELNWRLSASYEKASVYINHFHSPVLVVLAKHIAFVAGGLFAVLLTLTIIQEHLVTSPHILVTIGALGLVAALCRLLIPEECKGGSPKQIMHDLRQTMHYIPDDWLDKPHTQVVHRQFTQVFQFRLMYILDELLSPIVTPFILYFKLRPRALDLVNFFRQFTVTVTGVGDVCSYAEMDIRRHGNPGWSVFPESRPMSTQVEQAEMGKTEMSLVHFKSKHPNWKPRENEAAFLQHVSDATQSVMSSYIPSERTGPEQSLLFSMPPAMLASFNPLGTIPEGSMGQSENWAVYSMLQGGGATSQKDSINLNVLKHLHDQHVHKSQEGEHVAIAMEEDGGSPTAHQSEVEEDGGSWGWSSFKSLRPLSQQPAPDRALTSPLLQRVAHGTSGAQLSELPPLEEARPTGSTTSTVEAEMTPALQSGYRSFPDRGDEGTN